MTLDLQKSLNSLLVLLTVCLGLLLGVFVADWIGESLTPGQVASNYSEVEATRIKQPRLQDFSVISQRNLFDSTAKPQDLSSAAPSAGIQPDNRTTASRSIDLTLLGTVAGGERPLAIITSGKETIVYQVGDVLPGNLTLKRVERDRVVAESASGEKTILEMLIENSGEQATVQTVPAKSRAPAVTSSAKIVELGENHWQIPKEEAERARSNLNALLKTARMVPKIENGTTIGFTIVNIQRGTFLDMLGLKVGDVLVQINQVELNSPEKALQIFQQVREANNLSLGLLRNGSRQTFEYTID